MMRTNNVREYETVLVLSVHLEDAEIEKEIQGVQDQITSRGGQIVLLDRWGKRRLAYEIDRQHEGYYVLMRFLSGPDVPAELERRFRINERLLRHMTVLAETPLPPANAEAVPAEAAVPVMGDVE